MDLADLQKEAHAIAAEVRTGTAEAPHPGCSQPGREAFATGVAAMAVGHEVEIVVHVCVGQTGRSDMATTDGGAAFPRPMSKLNPDEVSGDQSGMSLRDWFAGQALAGLTGKMGWSGTERGREMAQWCYYMGTIMVEVGKESEYTDWAALIREVTGKGS